MLVLKPVNSVTDKGPQGAAGASARRFLAVSDSDDKDDKFSPEKIRHNVRTMKAMQLNQTYDLTYTTWKNMKSRCNNGGGRYRQEFDKFAEFLMHMGARRAAHFTLDRIDPNNPWYGPSECEWADKYAQNQNRRNCVYVTYKGETRTTGWARETRQSADTLYRRKKRGYSDEAVITGLHSTHSGPADDSTGTSRKIFMFDLPPHGRRDLWISLYERRDHKSESFRECVLRNSQRFYKEKWAPYEWITQEIYEETGICVPAEVAEELRQILAVIRWAQSR